MDRAQRRAVVQVGYRSKLVLAVTILAGFVVLLLSITPKVFAAQTPGAAPAKQVVGAVKSIRGVTITVAPDSGAEVNIDVRPNTRVLKIAPGETNLANAA